MRNLQTLDRGGFIDVLSSLSPGIWTASIVDRCIHLCHANDEHIHSPSTAVYFHLTGDILHRGSFWHPEITKRFNLPWWIVLEITYAETCCSAGGRCYDSELRLALLEAVAPLLREGNLTMFMRELNLENLKHKGVVREFITPTGSRLTI